MGFAICSRMGLSNLAFDLRYALRLILRQRGVSVVILVTLALGIGATTAMFSVINGVLLRPLPYPGAERVISILWGTGEGSRESDGAAPGNYLDLKREARAFTQFAGYFEQPVDLLDGEGDPARLVGSQVTEGFFDVLGVPAALGRTFTTASAPQEAGHAAVISDGVWRRRFGGSAGAIGKTVRINRQPYTIVGVMPPGFAWPANSQLWTLSKLDIPDFPIAVQVENPRTTRDVGYFKVIGRLKPEVSLAQAQTEANTLRAALIQRFPRDNRGLDITILSLKERLIAPARPALLILLGAVAFVLLIACANVANLLLAKATDRHREMAIRTALGAHRSRLVRQLLIESLVLAVVGGVLGLMLADWGTDLLLKLTPRDIPRLNEVHIDRWAALFAFGICLLTGLLFGLAPAFHASRVAPQDALRDAGGTRGAIGSTRGRWTRAALVVAQVALALMLAIGAGLMLTSFSRLQAEDPGFRPDQVKVMYLTLPQGRYATQAQQAQFYERVLELLETNSALAHRVTLTFPTPLQAENANASFLVYGRGNLPENERPTTAFASIAPDFFHTLGIPLIKGRDFDARDADGTPGVIIVNQTIARRYFPNEDPIGKQLVFGGDMNDPKARVTIVGVAGDVRGRGLDRQSPPMMYFPYKQFVMPFMALMMHTSASDTDVSQTVRAAVRQVDPDMPVEELDTLDHIVNRTIAQPRFRSTLLSMFAGAALLLAIVGVYGVLSYAVAQRQRELGIRAALGAQPRDLLKLVVGHGLTLTGTGIVAGLAGAFAVSGVLAGMLYGVASTDLRTIVLATGALFAAALLACALPAWRAMQLDPLAALRDE
jgi:putative ABC transport system permease protein